MVNTLIISIFAQNRIDMERVLINELHKWKDKPDRKPLILRGARQVGKTWLLKDAVCCVEVVGHSRLLRG